MTAKIDGTNGVLQQYDYQVLTTGFSYTFAAGTNVLVMNPAGTLATGTITMPASPADGMTITFSSTQTITALTVSANTGQSIVSAATVLPARQATTYVYRLSNTTWYPMSTVATNVPVAPAGGSIITSGTAVASTSGTSIDFTGIPSWVKRITVQFVGVSGSGTSIPTVRLGTVSGIETTGYLGSTQAGTTATLFTTGFEFAGSLQSAARVYHGAMTLTLQNSSTNTWAGTAVVGLSDGASASIMGGSKSTASVVTQLRITFVNGTDTFDAGSINILYE